MKACAKNVTATFELLLKAGFVKNDEGDYFKENIDTSLLVIAHIESKTGIWMCTYNQAGIGKDHEMKTFSSVEDLVISIQDDAPQLFK